jgi:plasmid maintenance system antidote protein VapI
METIKKYDSRVREVWTGEDFENIDSLLKQHYAQTPSIEKLEHALFAIKLDMQDYLIAEEIIELKSVGTFVEEAIVACKQILNISKKTLAIYWETTSPNLSKYLKGERSLNAELALKIASTLDIPAQLLLDIQIKNQLLELSNKKDYEKEFSLKELIRA